MNLLIIGGTGVLSGAVVKEALKHDIDVTIVNRGRKSKKVPDNVNLIIADYRNRDVMKSFLQGKHYDAVIDFICFNRPQIEYSIGLLSPFCSQYIFISSACVYDYSKSGVKTEDDEKVFKEWEYSVNKWDCECYLTEVAKSLHFNYTIIRPCVTFDDSRIPYGIVPAYGYHWTLVGRILSEKPIIRWNGGITKWNMMRVEDFAVGLVGIIGNMKAYNRAYNISGDSAYSWNDVLECIGNVVKKKVVFFDITSEEYASLVPEMRGRIMGRSSDLICSNKRIKELVPEFQTTIDLQTGIQKTINAYINDNYQKGIDYRFDALMDRVIYKSCMNHDVRSFYNLGFMDYLGNATIKERLRYYSQFYDIKEKYRKIKKLFWGIFLSKK